MVDRKRQSQGPYDSWQTQKEKQQDQHITTALELHRAHRLLEAARGGLPNAQLGAPILERLEQTLEVRTPTPSMATSNHPGTEPPKFIGDSRKRARMTSSCGSCIALSGQDHQNYSR